MRTANNYQSHTYETFAKHPLLPKLCVRFKNNFEFLILNEEKTIINLKFNI